MLSRSGGKTVSPPLKTAQPTAEVDQAQIKDELCDLHDGNVSLPPDLVACSCSPVVVVHDDVD